MESIQKLMAVNLLYTFIVAAMAVIVPLYLIDQQVDLAWIGIILSVGPLSFMVIRIFFASVADEIGTKAIAFTYSLMNVLSVFLYLFVVSPLGFAFATLAEGIRASGFWAIVRTEIFQADKSGNPGAALARFSNMRQLADGAGRLAAGFLIALFAFQGALAFVLALSVLLLIFIGARKFDIPPATSLARTTADKVFRPRGRTFWQAAMLQAFIWLAFNMLFVFVLPVYFTVGLRLDFYESGLLIALLSIMSGVLALFFVRLHIPKRDMLLLSILAVPGMLALPFVGSDVIPVLALLAVGMASANIVGEHILVDQVYRSKNVSTDIGVNYIPLKIMEVGFLLAGGFVVENFGFTPVLATLSLSVVLFVAFGRSAMAPGTRI